MNSVNGSGKIIAAALAVCILLIAVAEQRSLFRQRDRKAVPFKQLLSELVFKRLERL